MEKDFKNATVVLLDAFGGVSAITEGWVMSVKDGSVTAVMNQIGSSGSCRRFIRMTKDQAGKFLKITGYSERDPLIPMAGGVQALGGF